MTPTVILEDDWLLALDKPAGLAVHPGAGLTETLDDWLGRHLGPRVVRNDFRATAAHRLDRETSGVLLVAKRRPAMRALMQAFEARLVDKTYVALVRGSPPDAGRFEDPIRVEGKRLEAATSWRVLERLGPASLVECVPETGRRHQLRIHFAKAGHPIAGDRTYGKFEAERLCLHAGRLVFPHPRDGARTVVEAPLPADFRAICERLRGG